MTEPGDKRPQGDGPRFRREDVTTASGLNVVAGLWLILAPFAFDYDADAAVWNDVILGVSVATIAMIRTSGAYREAWLSWLNGALGAWLIIAPFVLGYSDEGAALSNDILLGVIVAGLAAWSAVSSPGPQT